MRIIGLTGSIGMGKSMTASLLRILKIPVHDSDATVHAMMARDGAAFQEIIAAFPEAFDKKNNRIDRAVLGKIVFADAVQRKKLETIIHPHVWESQIRFIQLARRMGFRNVVLDIPLLFETGSHRKCDQIICVTAPHFLQRLRVLKRVGMDEVRFRQVLSHQMPDAEKRKRSDFVVQTGLGRAATLQSLRKILKVNP